MLLEQKKILSIAQTLAILIVRRLGEVLIVISAIGTSWTNGRPAIAIFDRPSHSELQIAKELPMKEMIVDNQKALIASNKQFMPAFVAFLFGAFLVFCAGFAHSDTVHNAAHDTRHSFAFPCH